MENKTDVFCHRCKQYVRPTGIGVHLRMHKRNKENVKLTYPSDEVVEHHYATAEKTKDACTCSNPSKNNWIRNPYCPLHGNLEPTDGT